MVVEGKRFSLVKPNVNTPFHIDFDWWKKNERDWHVYLRTLLCGEHQATFENTENKTALQIALTLSEKSISNDPAAHRVDTYANLLYKLGRTEEAIKWETKAIELEPNEAAFKETLTKMKKGEKTWP